MEFDMRYLFFLLIFLKAGFIFAENPWFPGLEGDFYAQPKLPGKFMVGSPTTPANIEEGVVWGTKKGVKTYLETEDQPSSPVICVKMSQTVKQDGPMSFRGDAAMQRELKVIGRSKLKIKKYRWGHYPVLSISAISRAGIHYYIAFVGLNRQDQSTVMLTYLTSHEKNRPTEKESKLWTRLLTESGSGPS